MAFVVRESDEVRIALLKVRINELSQQVENPANAEQLKNQETNRMRLARKIIQLEELQNLAQEKMNLSPKANSQKSF